MEIPREVAAQIGDKAPSFNMPSTKNMETLTENVALNDYRGRWLVLFFYPLDFTFICPTEIRAFSDRIADFGKLDADIIGVSTDSVYSHRAWIAGPRDKGGLGPLAFPLASDVTKTVSRLYGVLLEDKGIALRGTFIIDTDQTLRYKVVHDLDVGRNVDEVLRVLQALQTGGLCPVNWQPGSPTL
ncbi:MAG: peroxiredoxin [Dehalococcoidia bacterium]|nr:peroxiredoxin [Dehalococcoidia bacterium]